MTTETQLRAALIGLMHSGPPKIAEFARWLHDNLPQAAFHSIRGLAQAAGVDANIVTRSARDLGYDGFDALRGDIRAIVQDRPPSYGARARALRNRPEAAVYAEVIDASRANLDHVTSPAVVAQIDACIGPLLAARRVHCVGVRSCYSVAHYLAYAGGMAFDNFAPVPSVPGAILDQMSDAGPQDIVIAFAYEHYSAEVVRACQIARDGGARILALTDRPTSPIAAGAWSVICLPMAGPQLMPSLSTAFLVAEMILAAMAARSPEAADMVARFEARITRYGGYFDGR